MQNLCTLGRCSPMEPHPLSPLIFLCSSVLPLSLSRLAVCKLASMKRFSSLKSLTFYSCALRGKLWRQCPTIAVSREERKQPWKLGAPLSQAFHSLLQTCNGCNFNHWRLFFQRYVADSPIGVFHPLLLSLLLLPPPNDYKLVSFYLTIKTAQWEWCISKKTKWGNVLKFGTFLLLKQSQ